MIFTPDTDTQRSDDDDGGDDFNSDATVLDTSVDGGSRVYVDVLGLIPNGYDNDGDNSAFASDNGDNTPWCFIANGDFT